MIDLATQFQTLSAASVAAVFLVVAAGLLMGVAPGSLPMYSVVVGSVAARSGRSTGPRRALLFALGFALGIAAADALIGALFGLFGQAVIAVLPSSSLHHWSPMSCSLSSSGAFADGRFQLVPHRHEPRQAVA